MSEILFNCIREITLTFNRKEKIERGIRRARFLLRNLLKNESQQKIIDYPKNEIPSNFI